MATIKFRIVDTNPDERQITVRFFSDVLTELELGDRTKYAVTLPIPTPEGDELRAFIMRYCPVEWFAMMHAHRAAPVTMPLLAIGAVMSSPDTPVVVPTEAEITAGYMGAVQQHMDAVAVSFGYDNLISVISYADEPLVPRYQAEGVAFRAWRSACWARCETLLAQVKAGEIATPTYAEMIALLPSAPTL